MPLFRFRPDRVHLVWNWPIPAAVAAGELHSLHPGQVFQQLGQGGVRPVSARLLAAAHGPARVRALPGRPVRQHGRLGQVHSVRRRNIQGGQRGNQLHALRARKISGRVWKGEHCSIRAAGSLPLHCTSRGDVVGPSLSPRAHHFPLTLSCHVLLCVCLLVDVQAVSSWPVLADGRCRHLRRLPTRILHQERRANQLPAVRTGNFHRRQQHGELHALRQRHCQRTRGTARVPVLRLGHLGRLHRTELLQALRPGLLRGRNRTGHVQALRRRNLLRRQGRDHLHRLSAHLLDDSDRTIIL